MNQAEVAYWDEIAETATCGVLRDNYWKRQMIVHRLLKDSWHEQRVLEIGIGSATAAAAINLLVLGKWQYIGTDLSPKFVEAAHDRFNLHTVQADITNLPSIEGGFTRMIALDSLEHVHPDDRTAGYKKMADVMAEHCRLYIHLSRGQSAHDKRFDHPFDISELHDLGVWCDMRIIKADEYYCKFKNGYLPYLWVVMDR